MLIHVNVLLDLMEGTVKLVSIDLFFKTNGIIFVMESGVALHVYVVNEYYSACPLVCNVFSSPSLSVNCSSSVYWMCQSWLDLISWLGTSLFFTLTFQE